MPIAGGNWLRMKPVLSQFRLMLILSLLLLGLPMLGAWLHGMALSPYLEFPPHTRHVVHEPFSWALFLLTSAVGLLSLAALAWLLVRDRRATGSTTETGKGNWPWWGWAGLLLTVAAWLLAWNRFAWFADWQWTTFTPLWLGYILVINAWTYAREGKCLLLAERRYFLSLFPLSTLFWWYFEYLNRFVQNWYYLGVDDFGPARYIVHASIAFSTVLPAVISTQQWLRSLLRLPDRPLSLTVSRPAGRRLAVITLLLSSIALLELGIWPNLLFPFLWFAPLLLLLGLQGMDREPDLLLELRVRGWQTVYLPALATLQCGFFWELWNFNSAAKWVYDVPFVDRFHLFEMPVVGFTGYLPFGVECLAIALLLRSGRGKTDGERTR